MRGVRLSHPEGHGHPVDGDVVDDPHPVAEPISRAVLDGLPDARQPEGLARVDGEVGVLALQVFERVQVAGRRVTVLGPGDVESGHPVVAVTHGQPGDLRALGRMAHRREQRRDLDRVTGCRGLALAVPEASVDRLDDLLEGQALGQVLLGGIATLGIDDAVGGKVEDALLGDPVQPLLGLHDRHRLVEGLQIAHERARVGAVAEPLVQLGDVGARQVGIPDLFGDLDDRLGAHSPVEVVVQEHLRGRDDRREIRTGARARARARVRPRAHGQSSRWTRSGVKAGRQTATYSAPSGPAAYRMRSPAVVTIDCPAWTS